MPKKHRSFSFINKAVLVLSFFSLLACSQDKSKSGSSDADQSSKISLVKKKVLYIDSYHAELPWVQGITEGILSKLRISVDSKGALDNSLSTVELKVVHMDTKRNKSESFKKEAGLNARKLIEEWAPDVVIASDDNASKYLIEPFYKNSTLPFVFCGVNGSADEYGFPTKNITGMLEVHLIPQLIAQLRKYTSGKKIGFIKGNSLSAHKEAAFFEKMLGEKINQKYATNMSDWKEKYKELQKEVDILLVGNLGAVSDWDSDKAALTKFIEKHTSIPTGTWDIWNNDLVLLTFSTVASEQGEWAAQVALDILSGTPPADIPITKNKKAAISLNMKLAQKLDVTFPVDLINSATLVSAERKKVLFINSYHKGYAWSDEIETGTIKALGVKPSDDSLSYLSNTVELKFHRMDTKLNKSEAFKTSAGVKVKNFIEQWKPDVIIASDDNAAKYVIVPYYKNSDLPVIFCGINQIASMYGFPTDNITGMISVTLAEKTIVLLKKYAKGDKIGYVGANTLSEAKNISYFQNHTSINFSDGKLVDTFEEWKKVYKRLQTSVDMIIWQNPIGIEGWNEKEAIKFIQKHSKIPSSIENNTQVQYALIGSVGIAEERGWWSGITALKILKGTPPNEIPVVTNKQSHLMINMTLAKNLGIIFPTELLDSATLYYEQ
ncbi:MAG: hypothetical protein OCD76_09075 [Reichenbachiella sp.]